MNVVNQALNQLGELLRSMTVGSRITAGLLLAVVVISLGFLFRSQITGGDEFLLGGQAFSADEINEMEAAWGKAGLSTYEVDGNRIRVPRSQRSAYMGALADQGAIPDKWGRWLEEMAADASPLASPREMEQKRRVFLQQQIKQVVEAMSGIERAIVLLDVETKRTGFRGDKLATASVSITPRARQPLSEETAEAIKAAVAFAVAGMSPANVAVTDLVTGRSFASPPPGTPGAQGNLLLASKQGYQRDYTHRIQQALRDVPGVEVAVNVELNGKLESVERTTEFNPKDAVVVHSQTESSRSTVSGAGPGGRPGLEAQQRGAGNQPANLAMGSAAPTKEDDQNSKRQDTIVPHIEKSETDSGLVPARVTVSVGVPGSYFRKVWEQQNPPPQGAEPKPPTPQDLAAVEQAQIQKIRDHVLKQIPPAPAGVDPAELVTVTTFPELPAEAPPETPISDTAATWLAQSWSTLGLFGLVIVSLMVLRSTVRSAPAGESMAPLPTSAAGEADYGEPGGAETEGVGEPGVEGVASPGARIRRRRVYGPSMRDDLVELVREDPDAAAKILRGWIGSGT